jgi:alkylation response protein AidB-like acyl-CoA dehydrogenase
MTALSADERQELAQSVRSACERLASEDRVRAVAYGEGGPGGADGHSGFDTVLWDALCNQVGVAAIALPEHLGGAGYGASALGVVAHELGRALAPVPFVSSTVLATGLLLDLTERDPDADKRLTGLIEGRRTAAAALTGDGGLWRRSAVTLSAARTGDDWNIDGTVRHVLGGTAADDLVVVAIADDGEPALFLLDPAVDGVVAEAERVLDHTRAMATITLSSAPALRLSGDGPIGDVVDRNVDMALAVLSAEQVGACERVLEIATDRQLPGHQTQVRRHAGRSRVGAIGLAGGPGGSRRFRSCGRRRGGLASEHGQGRVLRGTAQRGESERSDSRRYRLHLGGFRTPVLPARPHGRGGVRHSGPALGPAVGAGQAVADAAGRPLGVPLLAFHVDG